MKQIFTEDKLELAKKMIVYDFKRNKFSSIFELLKDDIKKLIDLGLPYKMILMHLNNELESNIKYDTFLKWIQKNIKQKNQSSNTLRKNTQKQKVELKKEETTCKTDKDEIKVRIGGVETEIKVHTNEKEKNNKKEETGRKRKKDKNWKSVIFPQIEKACEGMKKANLRI